MELSSKKTNRALDDRFQSARVSLTNGRDVPEAQAILGPLGYDRDRLTEGVALLDTAVAAAADQVEEYGEQYAATATLAQQVRAWRAAYVPHLEMARLRFRQTPAGAVLGLKGKRRADLGGLLMQGRVFYEGLRDTPALGDAMAEWKVTPGVVAAALGAIATLEGLAVTKEKEAGEAEVATRLRDDAVAALLDFLLVYEGLARIVLADEPQVMETLGLRERGS